MAINKLTCTMIFNVRSVHQRNFLSVIIQHLSSTAVINVTNRTDINVNYLHPNVVLSKKNRDECIERLQKFSISLHLNSDNTVYKKKAAVLVPLCLYNNELGFLYTLRSKTLTTNGGQVSFPGGRKDDADEDFQATALRETWEELRIPKENVDVWTANGYVQRQEFAVMPILGYIGEINPEKLTINRHEVEEAFVVSLRHICDPTYYRYTQFRAGYSLPMFVSAKHQIWGLTAFITHVIMRALVPEVYKHKLRFLKSVGTINSQYNDVNKMFD